MGFFWPNSPSRLIALLTTNDHQTYYLSMCTRASVLIESCLEAKEIYTIPAKDIDVHLNWAKNNYLSRYSEELRRYQDYLKAAQSRLNLLEPQLRQAEAEFNQAASVFVEKLNSPNLSADERRYLESAKAELEAAWRKKSEELRTEITKNMNAMPGYQKAIEQLQTEITAREAQIDDFRKYLSLPALEKYIELKLPKPDQGAYSINKFPDATYATHFFVTLNALYDAKLEPMAISLAGAGWDSAIWGFKAGAYPVAVGQYLLRVHHYPSALNDLRTHNRDRYECNLAQTLQFRNFLRTAKPLTEFAITVRYQGKEQMLMTRYYAFDVQNSDETSLGMSISVESPRLMHVPCSNENTASLNGALRITRP
jgi:uncharacterized protein YihD (DUF1040 family)